MSLHPLGSCLLPGQHFHSLPHPFRSILWRVLPRKWRPASWHPWQMGRLCVCICFLPLLSLRGFSQAQSIRHGPDFSAWPFLDSIRITYNVHTCAFVLNFKLKMAVDSTVWNRSVIIVKEMVVLASIFWMLKEHHQSVHTNSTHDKSLARPS